jgi:hypothetical protein
VQKILTNMIHELKSSRVVAPMQWKHCIFVAKTLRIFQKNENIWFLLRGIILWSLRIKQNNFIFNNEKWREKKLQTIIWNLLLIMAKLLGIST